MYPRAMPFARAARYHVSAATYVELVRSLSAALVPGAIMTTMFALTAAVCAADARDSGLFALAVGGTAIAVARIAMQLALRKAFKAPELDEKGARAAERLFASMYLPFAAVIGIFGAACLMICPIEEKMVVAALTVGFAAGVAASVSLRPWIAVPALLLSVTPMIVSAAFIGGTAYLLLAGLMAALAAGAIGSMIGRYRTAVEMIEMRQLFASLARQDPLTGLANRLALEDEFLRAVRVCGGREVVLHCLDLDRFKPVNDAYGHGVGDLLLEAVGRRLSRLLRQGDLAVRLGGDEFAVLQTGVRHSDEAALMARRIVRALGEPYSIEGHQICVGASVGTAHGRDHGPVLNQLLGVADKALYAVKQGGHNARALAG